MFCSCECLRRKFFLCPLKLAIWGPVNQSDKRQVSNRKTEFIYMYGIHMHKSAQ